jgi:glycosyltransferase involved in cell wall biosynthesis
MLIDVTRQVQRSLKGMLPTGVDRVGHAYLEHYADRATALLRVAGRWVVPRPRASQDLFAALLQRGPDSRRRIAWSAARALLSPASERHHRILLHTGHSGLDRARYASEIRRRQLAPIYFAHDLIPITHPQFCRAGEDLRHRQRVRTMLETGKALIVNSQATRAALACYASEHRMRLPECVVAPLAPAALAAPAERPPLAHDYFLILGTIEPRKNHMLLLNLWRQLVRQHGEAAPKLVVIGRRGWKCEREMEVLSHCTSLRRHVLHVPRCGDLELSSWLHHARALLFPSFAEGFGMPLVEALSLGVPVIASDLPVFREIAGAVPDFLDPKDEPAWQRAIANYMHPDGTRRRQQLERMRSYMAPSWREHFETVDALLDQCLHCPIRAQLTHG